MKLLELEPRFVRYETRVEDYDVVDGDPATWRDLGCPTKKVTGPREYTITVATLADAQGLWFLCPKCAGPNGDGHSIDVAFHGRGVLDNQGSHNKEGKPVRWNAGGSGLNDLTLTPSILNDGGCGWHGFVTNGEISTC